MMEEEKLSKKLAEDRENKKLQQSEALKLAEKQGFLDPISGLIMAEPVIFGDEKIYEEELLKYWFEQGKNTSPLTNISLKTTRVVPAQLHRDRIRKFLQENKHLIIENHVYLPRKYLEEFANAIKNKNVEKITELAERDIRLIYMSAQQAIQQCGTKYRDETEVGDKSGFHLACEVADIRIVMQMLEMLTANSASLDFITAQKPSQWNPLVLNQGLAVAIEKGNEHTCQEFLSIGADANFTDQKGNFLHRAVKKQKKEIVTLLLTYGANINAQDSKFDERTPLHTAVGKGDFEITKILLEAGAKTEIIAEKNYNFGFGGDRSLPLHIACRDGNESLVKLLVEYGANIEEKEKREDRKGNTPLMWASSRGHIAIVEFLLKSKANTETKDNLGWTALHWAARDGQKEIIELLMKHGANHKVKDRDGFTPIEVAQRRKDGGKEIINLISDLHTERKLNAIKRTEELENRVREQQKHIQELESRINQLENLVQKPIVGSQLKRSLSLDSLSSKNRFFETLKSPENLQSAIQVSLDQTQKDEVKQPTNQLL